MIWRLTDAHTGQDLTPRTFYRKSPEGRTKVAQILADAHDMEICLLENDSLHEYFHPTNTGHRR